MATFLDEGVLAEAGLRIAAEPLLLIAGELTETLAGKLAFCRPDESVLVFTDPAAASHAPWPTSRSSLSQIDETAAGDEHRSADHLA